MERLGEVIAASSTQFVVNCDVLGNPPALGAAAVVDDGERQIVGIIGNAWTAGIDPSRHVMPLGKGLASEEHVYREHPELPQLLRTDFRAIVVGYLEGDETYHRLPPRPARVHAFVRAATGKQLATFSQEFGFLSLLINSPLDTRDEAVAACLRLASAAHADPRRFLVGSGKELARLLAADSPRLDTLLRLMRP